MTDPAKKSSLLGQIIAALWIAGWSAYLFFMTPEIRSVTDIVFSGLAIAACFTPVYFSILLDKVVAIFNKRRSDE